MKTKLTFLLALTFLFLFSGTSVVFGNDDDDMRDIFRAMSAYQSKDYKTAHRLWLPLAEKGNQTAQAGMGKLYLLGDGVTRNDKEALKWLNLSAQQGDSEGQTFLGAMYKNGYGVTKDYKRALGLFRLSAKKGDSVGLFLLGTMYDEGLGVPQDYKEAVRSYRRSAELGHQSAQHSMGLMYEQGKGVRKDYVLAHMWFNICSSADNKDCVKSRNIIDKKMSPSQIQKAQEMARNWKKYDDTRSIFEQLRDFWDKVTK